MTLISCFRNATGYIERYFDQVDRLRDMLTGLGHDFFGVWGEGDSTDKTKRYIHLFQYDFNLAGVVVDCDHGGPEFGSEVNTERFRQLAYVANRMWAHIPADTDIVIDVESDLIWEPETMLTLIDRLQDYPAISPMVWMDGQRFPRTFFYDVWAFRKNGQQFSHYPPYCDGFDADKPFMVDSAGSCMAIRGDLARKLVWDENVFVGISRQIYEHGASLWVDPTVACFHE